MAFLMLCTSMGLRMDMHFCQGNLQSISLLGKAKSCHELIQSDITPNCTTKGKSCCLSKQTTITFPACQKDCCHNQTVDINLDTQLISSSISGISLEQLSTTIIYLVISSFLDFETTFFHIFQHPPPSLLYKNNPSFVQSFLC